MNSIEKPDPAIRVVSWVFIAVLVVLSLVPGDYRPHLEGATKESEHVLAYAGTAGAFAFINPGLRRTMTIVFLLTALGALLELGQLMVSGRNASFRDVIADAVGALIGVGLVVVGRRVFSWRAE